jgi:hypothetical protein
MIAPVPMFRQPSCAGDLGVGINRPESEAGMRGWKLGVGSVPLRFCLKDQGVKSCKMLDVVRQRDGISESGHGWWLKAYSLRSGYG